MSKVTAKYAFDRPANSMLGIGSHNRPSTDALSALHRWKAGQPGRDFAVEVDGDDRLIAEIVCEINDVYAGAHLDAQCLEFGVRRQISP